MAWQWMDAEPVGLVVSLQVAGVSEGDTDEALEKYLLTILSVFKNVSLQSHGAETTKCQMVFLLHLYVLLRM